IVQDIRIMGKEGKHVRLKVMDAERKQFDAIGFGMAEVCKDLQIGDSIDIAYTITENTWNDRRKLELRLKDIKREIYSSPDGS
ncbi:MAG: hypothetical protein ACRDFB_05920, partial [Rhabdochlamydiaceae bacterium]